MARGWRKGANGARGKESEGQEQRGKGGARVILYQVFLSRPPVNTTSLIITCSAYVFLPPGNTNSTPCTLTEWQNPFIGHHGLKSLG